MLDNGPCDSRHPIDELCPEDDVGIVEEAILVRNDEKLRLWKVLLDHPPYVLTVVQVQGRINLVENVEGGWLEPEQRK